ncbi:MAG: 16S rRNA (guanine(966)-N(2))-methyltransferase RsmD [Methylophilaceae bacterium]|nr:16S rRNA (guanine(966)-N(2))-methyltransferase RsmD [Methylophilaceae bacterium]
MSSKTTNTVRISAGEWRSRLLKFPDVEGLRPTPDRVRQTVFNWLGQELHGLSCLDLFAGTGVMGFEAMSRGAQQVILIEKSRPAYQALIENKASLKAQNVDILNMDALQFLAQTKNKFDVIFVDPPYQQGWVNKVLPLIKGVLAEGGLIYVEAEYAITDSDEWQVVKNGKAGNVFYHLVKPT